MAVGNGQLVYEMGMVGSGQDIVSKEHIEHPGSSTMGLFPKESMSFTSVTTRDV